jgi:hypothetical protein
MSYSVNAWTDLLENSHAIDLYTLVSACSTRVLPFPLYYSTCRDTCPQQAHRVIMSSALNGPMDRKVAF